MRVLAILKAKWVWYSVLCIILWAGWAIFSKLGSDNVPPVTMQFLFTLGTLPVAALVLLTKHFRFEKSWNGFFYGTANGVLSGIGSVAFFAAFRSGGNASIITTATALYPMITVVLAVLILRERLSRLQVIGLCFAAVALWLFSL